MPQRLFFSIRIRLKPLQLALTNFSAPIGLAGKNVIRGFSKMLQNAIVEYTPWGFSIGAEEFLPLSDWRSTIFLRQSDWFETSAEQNYYSAPIGER